MKLDFGFWAVALVSLGIGASAGAVPSPLLVKVGKVSPAIKTGVAIGGQAGVEFSLLSVQSEASPEGERLILGYGDRYGNSLKAEPGFYQIALDRDARRLVIDLAQVNKTAVDPQKLARILLASKLVASSEITMDPYDGSTNITLLLKEPVRLKVGSDIGRQASVVIELERIAGEAGRKP